MTPDDVAAIRARHAVTVNTARESQAAVQLLALCTALEAAWAEAAFWKADDCCGNRERAERLQRENEELRRELGR